MKTGEVVVVRYGREVRHDAYPLMGGKEYETYCGIRWKAREVAVTAEESDCGNCRAWRVTLDG